MAKKKTLKDYKGRNIEFAPTEKITKYGNIARDFLKKIFNKDLDECFISDMSCVYDFIHEETYEEVIDKIEKEFSILLSETEVIYLPLASVFEKIKKGPIIN